MSGAVKEFVDRKWPEVQSQIECWRLRECRAKDTLAFVRALYKDWEGIALEEKQIPYVTLESTFWASVNILYVAVANAVPGATQNDSAVTTEELQVGFNDRLDRVYPYLRDRLPIPESSFDGVWRRHLP